MSASNYSAWKTYLRFANEVKHERRYLGSKTIRAFLGRLTTTAKRRVATIDSGHKLFRAQVGHVVVRYGLPEYPAHTVVRQQPFAKSRMLPLRHSAHEGRVNPKGIPCLYAASDELTALSEVRPWLGALVSVATIKIERTLRLVDCCAPRSILDNPLVGEGATQRVGMIWRHIGHAFSEPVEPDVALANYAPTQMIAEHLRSLGYDGLIYESLLGSGRNYAIFDLDSVSVSDVCLREVSRIQYSATAPQDLSRAALGLVLRRSVGLYALPDKDLVPLPGPDA
jgi:hypothetical protein